MPARSKIAMLPADLRAELDRRIVECAFSGYQGMAEWLQEQGYPIAHDSVQRYGSRLQQRLEAMQQLAENARTITAAVADTGDNLVDASIQLIHQRVLSMLLEAPEPREETDGVAVAAGASPAEGDGTPLTIRDLVRLTGIVAALNRVTIARQRRAREVQRLGQQHAQHATEGGLSEEAYSVIPNPVLGINPCDPEHRDQAISAVRASRLCLIEPGELGRAASPTQLDADNRSSPRKRPMSDRDAIASNASPGEEAAPATASCGMPGKACDGHSQLSTSVNYLGARPRTASPPDPLNDTPIGPTDDAVAA